jgi:YggT family protein
MGGILLTIISIVFRLFELLLLGRILISWVNLDPYNPIVRFLYNTTEPFLGPVRRRLPATGGFDFSPLVVIIIAIILQQLLTQIVYSVFSY